MEELTRDRIDDLVRNVHGPVFIDVWGPQCQPCLALAPTYETMAAAHGDSGHFLKLEAPKNRMACVDLRVMGLPTFLLYVDGTEKSRISGESLNSRDLETWIETELSSWKEVSSE
jgi:thioredoxin 1